MAALGVSIGLAGCAPALSTKAPDVGILFGSAEVNEAKASCLKERGWTIDLQDDGTIFADFPEEQVEAYQADSTACLKEAGIDPDAPMTQDQYRAAFAWYEEIASCLLDAGWSVPDKPSYEVFKTSYDTDPWIPWSEVPGEQIMDAHSTCPVMDVPTA
ncbi:hypothetical protein [Rathayibacter sp. Leaf248]|uniref:hypothetical protein n=1 Tax=Rathayibacter sp. Leaf248 TaxID=2876555 RepID=UPI001E446ECD|nr:hypothetical protein [Rathayibacter sp. Leaf248]